MCRQVLLAATSALAVVSAQGQQGAVGRPTPCIVASQLSHVAAVATTSSYIQHHGGAHPTEALSVYIPAESAHACLMSLPLYKREASILVESLKEYLQFHTTIKYLTKRPSGLFAPRQTTDILAGLDVILKTLKVPEAYQNREYDFQVAVYEVINQARDGHLTYIPDVLGKLFQFERPVQLASVLDLSGRTHVPKIYDYSDIIRHQKDSGMLPIPVVKINGEEVNKYLQMVDQDALFQDSDAIYNSALYNQVWATLRSGNNRFQSSHRYWDSWTNLTFEDGKKPRNIRNRALVKFDLTDLGDATALVEKCCIHSSIHPVPGPQQAESAPPPTNCVLPPISAGPLGFPSPTAQHPQNFVAGYYLRNIPDTAVLSIPSFETTEDPCSLSYFEQVVQRFLLASHSNGKQKLIIDLRGNGGREIELAYNTFKQIFPATPAIAYSRFRAHGTLQIIVSNMATTLPNSVFDWRYWRNYFNQAFTNWQSFYGSLLDRRASDNFTNTLQWPPDAGLGQVTGLFSHLHIVLLHDGLCASACAAFSELMRSRAGVRSVVLGGRSRTGPMQAVGGAKGAQAYDLSDLRDLAYKMWEKATPAMQRAWVGTSIETLKQGYAVQRATKASINLRDNFRLNILGQPIYPEANIPLQFVYEAADCRLFYTRETIINVSAVWTDVHNVMLSSPPTLPCVVNSTLDKSSLTAVQRTQARPGNQLLFYAPIYPNLTPAPDNPVPTVLPADPVTQSNPPANLHPPTPSPSPSPVQRQPPNCFNGGVPPNCSCPLGKTLSNGQCVCPSYSTPFNSECKCQHLGIPPVCCPEGWPYNQFAKTCFQTPIANAIVQGINGQLNS